MLLVRGTMRNTMRCPCMKSYTLPRIVDLVSRREDATGRRDNMHTERAPATTTIAHWLVAAAAAGKLERGRAWANTNNNNECTLGSWSHRVPARQTSIVSSRRSISSRHTHGDSKVNWDRMVEWRDGEGRMEKGERGEGDGVLAQMSELAARKTLLDICNTPWAGMIGKSWQPKPTSDFAGWGGNWTQMTSLSGVWEV